MRRTFGLASDGLCLRACGLGRGARAESQPLPTPATMPSASRAITLRGPSQTAWWVSKPWAGLLRARDCTSHLDTSRACSRPPPSSNLRAGIRGRQGLQVPRKRERSCEKKKHSVISVRARRDVCRPVCWGAVHAPKRQPVPVHETLWHAYPEPSFCVDHCGRRGVCATPCLAARSRLLRDRTHTLSRPLLVLCPNDLTPVSRTDGRGCST